jgi:hypothetical protein
MRTTEPYFVLAWSPEGSNSNVDLVRTIFLVIFKLNEMPVTSGSLVSVDPVCKPGWHRAGEFRQRV